MSEPLRGDFLTHTVVACCRTCEHRLRHRSALVLEMFSVKSLFQSGTKFETFVKGWSKFSMA